MPLETNGNGSRGFHLIKEISQNNIHSTIITSNSNHLGKTPNLSDSFFYENISNVNFFWLKTLKYKKTTSLRRILGWIDFEIKLLYFIFFKKQIRKPDVIIVSSPSILTIISGFILSLFI